MKEKKIEESMRRLEERTDVTAVVSRALAQAMRGEGRPADEVFDDLELGNPTRQKQARP
jgi:hypothetical protein